MVVVEATHHEERRPWQSLAEICRYPARAFTNRATFSSTDARS